jgi:uncharacterized protein YceK
MRSYRLFFVASVLFLTALSSGCGTVCNLVSSDREVYGGVPYDLSAYRSWMESREIEIGELKIQGLQGREQIDQVGEALIDRPVGVLVLVTDGCLSVVGDTLTFPLAYLLQIVKVKEDARRRSQQANEQPETPEVEDAKNR